MKQAVLHTCVYCTNSFNSTVSNVLSRMCEIHGKLITLPYINMGVSLIHQLSEPSYRLVHTWQQWTIDAAGICYTVLVNNNVSLMQCRPSIVDSCRVASIFSYLLWPPLHPCREQAINGTFLWRYKVFYKSYTISYNCEPLELCYRTKSQHSIFSTAD